MRFNLHSNDLKSNIQKNRKKIAVAGKFYIFQHDYMEMPLYFNQALLERSIEYSISDSTQSNLFQICNNLANSLV